jgi:hypothetical protein
MRPDIALMTPGRGEDCDYEASSALRTLLEAESLKASEDEDLFERIRKQVRYNRDCLNAVDDLLGKLIDDGEDPSDFMARVTKSAGKVALNGRY